MKQASKDEQNMMLVFDSGLVKVEDHYKPLVTVILLTSWSKIDI